MPRKNNPPEKPANAMKAIVKKVEENGRPNDQPYKVKARPKRPRVKRGPLSPKLGGWKGNPNSIAALEAHRARTYLHKGGLRECDLGHCSNPAVRGVPFCRWHGGVSELNVRRRLDPNYKPRRISIFQREIRAALNAGSVPHDLMSQPIFRKVLTAATTKHDFASTKDGYARWRHANAVLLEMINAWAVFEDTADLLPWVSAVRKANEAHF